MSDLVEFLRARLDEDEQVARAAEQAEAAHLATYAEDPRVTVTEAEADLSNRWDVGEEDQNGGWSITAGTYTEARDGRVQKLPWTVVGPGYTGGGVVLRATAEHIARHDPARVLREVAAQRRKILTYEQAADYYTRHREAPAGEAHGLYTALRLDAEVHADHPDYQEEWRV